jgi:sugar/nucleoside kinase (ribokinase family)
VNIVCAADCGVDRFSDLGIDRAGGIGLNVAVHLRRLCGPSAEVSVVAPVGDDDGARVVREAVARAGLRDRLVTRPGATPVQHVRHDATGERLFEHYDEGVLRGFRLERAQRDLVARSDLLTTAAFGQGLDLFESAMASPSQGLRAVDFTNANDIGDPLAFVERHVADFHVGFFGLGEQDEALIDGLEAIARRTERLLVVTLGAAGSIALGGAARIRRRAEPVEQLVDTTGAGDAFAAGFLHAYAASKDVARGLDRGSLLARETLGRLGSF